MIPSSVEKFLTSRKGNVFRTNPASAATALKNLGVKENSQFGEFYLKYQGVFISPKDEPELLDIDDVAPPQYQIKLNTSKAYTRYQITISP
ncbi:hypothetical protein JOS77_17480 [Chromobacterium haemolyticum]|nr:hypothetical protein JOS77_17480 [Chromobacterium haemolyticum]